jgi:HNH endonuclease
MQKKIPAPMPVEDLRAILGYDPKTGRFWWKTTGPGKGHRAGAPAGHVRANNGYRTIGIAGKTYYANRLAWYLTTGVWPTYQVDHRNRVTSDDRIDNLRPATPSQNACNSVWKKNSSGYRGVYRYYRKWVAKIRVNYRDVYLGLFSTREEAYAAVCKAIESTRGEFARMD